MNLQEFIKTGNFRVKRQDDQVRNVYSKLFSLTQRTQLGTLRRPRGMEQCGEGKKGQEGGDKAYLHCCTAENSTTL